MDVHESPTLPLPHDDPTTSSAHNFLKKRTAAHEDCSHYETVRKKIHTNEENEKAFSAETAKKGPPSFDGEDTTEKQPATDKLQALANISATTPLRQKFAQWIPESHSEEYSLEQRTLLRIQNYLDEHLFYLKSHRGKKKGEFFKSLRKNLIQGSGIIMELHQLKQILFVDHALYLCSRELVRDHSYDLLLDLPAAPDIPARRAEFRDKLHRYIRSQRGFEKGRRVAIPMHKFDFELEIEYSNQMLAQRREEEFAESQQEEAKQENERIGNPKNFFNKGSQFKATLDRLIEAKETRIRESQSLNERRYGKEQVLKVIDQVFVIYTGKAISNMFQRTLVESISRKLLVLDSVVEEIVELLLDNAPYFLKRIENSKGVIVQIDVKKYKTCRENIKEIVTQ